MNLAVLSGNLGKKPMIQKVNDVSKVMFSVACNESYFDKTKNEYAQKTEWVNVEFWTKDPSKFEGYDKGDTLEVQGKNASSSWEKEGERFFKQFIKAKTVKRLRKGSASKDEVITNVDLPF